MPEAAALGAAEAAVDGAAADAAALGAAALAAELGAVEVVAVPQPTTIRLTMTRPAAARVVARRPKTLPMCCSSSEMVPVRPTLPCTVAPRTVATSYRFAIQRFTQWSRVWALPVTRQPADRPARETGTLPANFECTRGSRMAVDPALDPAVDVATDARPNALNVDLDAIAHNVRRLRAALGGDFTFVASLKANAYGFGLSTVASTVLSAGADALAVASVDDAIELRRLIGTGRPIIAVWRHPAEPPGGERGRRARHHRHGPRRRGYRGIWLGGQRSQGAAQGRRRPRTARRDARRGGRARPPDRPPPGTRPRGRLHAPARPARAASRRCRPIVEWQYERFVGVLDELEADGVAVPIRMAASSGALRLTDAMTLNAIDVGSLLYGLEPPGPADRDLGLRPALISITSRLTSVRDRAIAPSSSSSPPSPPAGDVRLGVIPMGATRRSPRAVRRPGPRPGSAGRRCCHLAGARSAGSDRHR